MEDSSCAAVVDFNYEFMAPQFFDFINGESGKDVHKAEVWFHTAHSCAPSPILPRIKIKASRSIKMDSVCDLSEVSVQKGWCEDEKSILTENASSTVTFPDSNCKSKITPSLKEVRFETNTPKLQATQSKGQTISIYHTPRNMSQLSHGHKIKPCGTNRNVKKIGDPTPFFSQETQAIKRQKLDEGGSRSIIHIKPKILAHKTSAGVMGKASNLCPSTVKKTPKEDRKKIYVQNTTPFVSMAETAKKFEFNTREKSQNSRKLMLKITKPIGPEFETNQRVRPIKVKSSVEVEEEILAQTIKFKARPLNKKILEGSTVSSFQRKPPQTPKFQEFHLQTTLRAKKNEENNAKSSIQSSQQTRNWEAHLKEPKMPILQTALRTRAVVKSSDEIEIEELEKVPKFKARPLNKKIFESKGVLGVLSNKKRHATVPQEFNFAMDRRIPPQTLNVTDLFDKLSLNSEYHQEKRVPRNTTLNPFHLYTEERGVEKERKFVVEVMQKELQEDRARVPKACPYPYSTDYPLIPPRPEPKGITRPEPFHLESLERHKEEIEREKKEQERMKIETAQKRIFKARPILKRDPVPVHKIERRPLIQVQEFNLQADQRAAKRAEFDKKVKEKAMVFKRYREEKETARMADEENALKQLRRTMVPRARTVPDFNHPFLPQKSAQGTTKAKSPNLFVLQKKEMRKMRPPLPATSSPATDMR